MDPSLKKYMNTLKRQANKSKIATLAGITPRPIEREVVPVEAVAAPVQGRKGGDRLRHPVMKLDLHRAVPLVCWGRP